MTKLEQAARQALEALSDCVDDSRTVLSQNEQIYTERYRPHVLIEQERVVKDAETAIAALHEALSGVQALSAAPAASFEKALSAYLTGDGFIAANDIPNICSDFAQLFAAMTCAVRWAPSSAYWSEQLRRYFGEDAREGIDALEKQLRDALAASPPPPAEQAAPKAAPGELSADSLRHQNKLLAETLGACILASGIVRKDIDGFTGPELLHFGEDLRSMLEAAPQQEAQELNRLRAMEHAFHKLMEKHELHPGRTDDDLLQILDAHLQARGEKAIGEVVIGEGPTGGAWNVIKWREDAPQITPGMKLYTAPQPAPAPLSEREAFEAWIEKDGGDLGTFGTPPNMHYRNSSVNNAWVAWKARAALAAQGGKNA